MTRLHKAIFALLILTPAISMLSGLAVAPLFGLVIALSIAAIIPSIKQQPFFLRSPVAILLLCFLFWALLTCLWAINPLPGLALWGRLAFLLLGGLVSLAVIVRMPYSIHLPIAGYALVIALMIALEERLSNGLLTEHLHRLSNATYQYNVTELNRGATILALCLWPALIPLIRSNRNILALLLAGGTFALLLSLTSLSAVMGIAAGAACFLLVCWQKERAITAIMIMMVAAVLAVPFVMTLQNPQAIMQHFPSIPASSEHRLYIWHFASHKALLHPLEGWGLNASRFIPIHPTDMLPEGRSPLPLHPHNNVTQLWLELGVPGVLFFAAFIALLLTRIQKMTADTIYKSACVGGLAAYFTIGLTAFGMWQDWWVSAGLMLALWLAATRHTGVTKTDA